MDYKLIDIIEEEDKLGLKSVSAIYLIGKNRLREVYLFTGVDEKVDIKKIEAGHKVIQRVDENERIYYKRV